MEQELKETKEHILKLNEFYLERVALVLNMSTLTKEAKSEMIKDLFYDLVEEIYVDILKILGDSSKPHKNLGNLLSLYQGRTPEERLMEHIQYYQETKNLVRALERIELLFNNESFYLLNHVLYEDAKSWAVWGEVVTDEVACGRCYDAAPHGRVPIEELEGQLPPYHPDCRCYVIYT